MRNKPLQGLCGPFKQKEEKYKPDPAILTDKEKAKLTEKFRDRDFIKEKFNIMKWKKKNIQHDWSERFV